jgi:hypothetical protein
MLVLLEAGECSSFRCGPDTAHSAVADARGNTSMRDPERGELLLDAPPLRLLWQVEARGRPASDRPPIPEAPMPTKVPAHRSAELHRRLQVGRSGGTRRTCSSGTGDRCATGVGCRRRITTVQAPIEGCSQPPFMAISDAAHNSRRALLRAGAGDRSSVSDARSSRSLRAWRHRATFALTMLATAEQGMR